MILRQLQDISEYCNLAEPHVGVFASEKWLSIYGPDLKVIGIYRDEKQIIGGFFYLKTKRFGKDFVKLPPYTPHCGLYFRNDSTNPASRASFSKEVMDLVSDHLLGLKSSLCILAFPYVQNDFQHFIWKGFKIIPNYTYHIDLSADMETIISGFDSKHRNAIAKARKEGVEVTMNTVSMNEALSFFENSLQQAGANIYKEELSGIFHSFSDDDNSRTFIARSGNTVVGMVHCIMDRDVCYYLLGGVIKDAGIQGINNLLVLEAIEFAKSRGCKLFDFEGSMLPGVEKFFRGFGPRLVPYYTANKAGVLLEILLKFYKRSIF